MVMSDRPAFALLFDVRAESCKSRSNSFGASEKTWSQSRKEGCSTHLPDQFPSASRIRQSYPQLLSRDPSLRSSPS